MAEHMTAEHMVNAIKCACDTIRRLQKCAHRSKSNRNSAFVKSHDLDYLSVELHWLDEVAARLSGMAADSWIEVVRGKLESITQCYPLAVHTLAREALEAMPAAPEPPHV